MSAHNRDPMNPENRPGNPGVITSSSSDDGNNSSGDSGNNSSGDSDEAGVVHWRNSKKPASSSYKDYSRVPPDNKSLSSSFAQGNAARDPKFVVKLHMILSNSEFESIITWLPHGRSWRILRPKDFEEKVIPLYFRHGRYSSFMRQVNGWGFRRVTTGPDYNSYYHQLFLRGIPHLCGMMRRLTNKDVCERKNEEETPAPDFYEISREHPLPELCPADLPASIPPLVPPAFAAATQFEGQTPTPSSSEGNVTDNEFDTLGVRRADIVQQLNVATSHQATQAVHTPNDPVQEFLQRVTNQQQARQTAPQPVMPAPVASAPPGMANIFSLLQNQVSAAAQPVVAAASPPIPTTSANALLLQICNMLAQHQQQQQAPPPPPPPPPQQANAQLSQIIQSLLGNNNAQMTPPPQQTPPPPPPPPTTMSSNFPQFLAQPQTSISGSCNMSAPTSGPSGAMLQQLAMLLGQMQGNGGGSTSNQ